MNREQDFAWFVENYNAIYQKYGHAFIAIKNKQIIGVYKNIRTAVTETFKTESPENCIIQECNGKESAYSCYIASNNKIVI